MFDGSENCLSISGACGNADAGGSMFGIFDPVPGDTDEPAQPAGSEGFDPETGEPIAPVDLPEQVAEDDLSGLF